MQVVDPMHLPVDDNMIDPKVMEPFDPIPGRVPRKVAIDRLKKEYASFDIEQLLQIEVDFNITWDYTFIFMSFIDYFFSSAFEGN